MAVLLGDVLAGTVGAFLSWAYKQQSSPDNDNDDGKEDTTDTEKATPRQSELLLLAAYGGCLVTRYASHLAFADLMRSMTTSDVIDKLPASMNTLFPLSAE